MTIDECKHTVEKLSIDMFNIHTRMIATNEKIVKLNAKNAMLNTRNEELELTDVHTKNLKHEVEYLKNKVLCVDQIENALREQIFENELQIKAYKNLYTLVKSHHDNHQEKCKEAMKLHT